MALINTVSAEAFRQSPEEFHDAIIKLSAFSTGDFPKAHRIGDRSSGESGLDTGSPSRTSPWALRQRFAVPRSVPPLSNSRARV